MHILHIIIIIYNNENWSGLLCSVCSYNLMNEFMWNSEPFSVHYILLGYRITFNQLMEMKTIIEKWWKNEQSFCPSNDCINSIRTEFKRTKAFLLRVEQASSIGPILLFYKRISIGINSISLLFFHKYFGSSLENCSRMLIMVKGQGHNDSKV